MMTTAFTPTRSEVAGGSVITGTVLIVAPVPARLSAS
jgi:hypothetical protein